MKRVLTYLTNYKKECIFAPLFKMLEASFELLVPLVMAAVIDTGIGTGDKHYVLQKCIVLVLLGIIGLTCSITAQYFAAKAAVGFATGLRHALFSHIQSLSFTEMDTIGTSTLITRMTSDINQAQNGVNMFIRLAVRAPFLVIGAAVMAVLIDLKLSLIFFVVAPVISAVIFFIMRRTVPMYKQAQKRLDRAAMLTRENLEGTRVIRAFSRQQQEIDEFKNAVDDIAGSRLSNFGVIKYFKKKYK